MLLNTIIFLYKNLLIILIFSNYKSLKDKKTSIIPFINIKIIKNSYKKIKLFLNLVFTNKKKFFTSKTPIKLPQSKHCEEKFKNNYINIFYFVFLLKQKIIFFQKLINIYILLF